MNEEKINEIIKIIFDFVPCVACPCSEYCPYIFLRDRQECAEIFRKWMKDEY